MLLLSDFSMNEISVFYSNHSIKMQNCHYSNLILSDFKLLNSDIITKVMLYMNKKNFKNNSKIVSFFKEYFSSYFNKLFPKIYTLLVQDVISSLKNSLPQISESNSSSKKDMILLFDSISLSSKDDNSDFKCSTKISNLNESEYLLCVNDWDSLIFDMYIDSDSFIDKELTRRNIPLLS